ncbi:MAG TPA: hypothetical protein VLN57_14475 [Xanthobacteraceae bacterium]|nr:hypothetical protein [Xanthobacteraceae bacterium]
MAKNPSTHWYFNDWVTDLAVRKCGMAARGFWMEMLAVAAAATPRGYVKDGDKPCSICDLARITGQRKQDISRWVRELEKNGVFSRTEDGTMFCRRMVREAEMRRKASHRRKVTPPGVAHPQRETKQPGLFDNPKKTHTRAPALNSGSFATSPDKSATLSEPLPSSDAACDAPPEEEEIENRDPEDASAARLGDRLRVHREPDAAITETPVGNGPAGVLMGVTDALPSMASATDHTPRPGEAATAKAAAPLLPANPADLDLDGQNHDNSQQEPAMDTSHGCSPELAASRPLLGAVAVLGPGSCQRTGKSPALRAKIKGQLASKHWRYLLACGPPDEAFRYVEAIDSATNLPPQELFDAVDARMRAARWDDMRQWKCQNGVAA